MTPGRITSSSIVTLIAAYLGLFVGLVDANAVNLALPVILADLGGGISGAQWTIDAYNVAFAAVLLTAGSLGDRFGRRALLRSGLITFVVAALACAAAPSLPLLLAARALQGVGAGGVLTDTLGWRYIFWINIPVGLAALLMTYRVLSESRNPDARGIDLAGQTFAILGLATLTLVLVEGGTMAPQWTLALAFVAAASIGLFFWTQGRVKNPMLPLGLLRNHQLVAALIATFAMTFGTYGMLMVNSFAFQQQRGESALATAAAFLPMPLTYLALIPVVNVVAHRTGPKLPMLTGLVLMAAGMLVYAVAGPNANIVLLEAGFVLTGAGLAFNTGPAVGLAMSAMPLTRAGLASGVANLARLVGITVGVAALGTVMALDGVRPALLAGAVVELIGAAVVLRWVSSKQVSESKEVCHA